LKLEDRIFNYRLKGYCCSQIILAMAFEDMGKAENEDLIAAAGAFCDGFREGRFCGTLTAALCVLYIAGSYEADMTLRAEMMDWFFDCYGSYECEDITEGNPLNKLSICPSMLASVYERLLNMLEGKMDL
jgi:hypothetical protein